MSLPKGKQDLVGNLVLSGSAELGIPVGTTVATGDTLTSNTIEVPIGCTVLALVDMTSGACTVKIDAFATSADFDAASGNAVSSETGGQPTFVTVDTDLTNYKVAVQIKNLSGSNMIVTRCGLLVLAKLEPNEDFNMGRGNALVYSVGNDHNGDGDGVFDLTTLSEDS